MNETAENAPETEEASGIALILDKLDEIETRLTRLEAIAHSGHEITSTVIDTIAATVIARINDSIRTRLTRGA